MPKRIAKVICSVCGKTVVAYRATKGRILVTTTAGLVLAGIGGLIGTGFGIASGGWGVPATIPLAIVGLVVGSGLGYLVADNVLDKVKCPKCGARLDLGL